MQQELVTATVSLALAIFNCMDLGLLWLGRVHERASCLASRIAATMLEGLAFPRPAMS